MVWEWSEWDQVFWPPSLREAHEGLAPSEMAQYVTQLEVQLAAEDAGRLRDDARFLLGFVPEWAKEVPEGLDPTFYGTLSAAGDREVKA